jgi:hypothetical protein
MATLLSGRAASSIELFRAAAEIPSQNQTDARLGLTLAAHFAGDVDVARECLARMDQEVYSGNFIEGTRLLVEAGIAALEGRSEDALAGFSGAVERFGRNSSRLHAAVAQLDALTLLPHEPSIADWADTARERFEVVKSPPLLALLDKALAARSRPPVGDTPGAPGAPAPAEPAERRPR